MPSVPHLLALVQQLRRNRAGDMSVQPYAIDPAWPVVESGKTDFDYSEVEECEICNARWATKLVDLWGCEGWSCDYCR